MAGFIPHSRQQQFLKAGTRFFHWWFTELGQLLPAKWRSGLSGRRSMCRVTIDNAQLMVSLDSGGQETHLGSISVTSFANAEPEASPSLGGEQGFNSQLKLSIADLDNEVHANVVLALADEYLLMREITLPQVSESEIASLLQYEIDRLGPFPKDNVCYDYEVLEDSPQSGQLKLHLICMEKAILEGLLEHCLTLGLTVTRVARMSESSAVEHTGRNVNLLPAEKRPAKEKVWNSSNKLTAMLVALLLLTAVLLPVWHYQQQVTTLSDEVNALLEKSKVVREKQSRLMTRLDIRDALIKRKNSEFEKLQLLHDLTRAIPGNTWLNRMSVWGLSLEIQGESDKSSDLIEKLESLPGFHQVSFASSVTRNSATGKERFQIKMGLLERVATLSIADNVINEITAEQQVNERGASNE